jgi:CTP:molybdopterin cytidylyltransferase MocA
VIAGVILAAGASSRMGGHPKALLDYRGETFVARLVRVLSGVCDPVIVVLGYDAERVRPAVDPCARVVINAAPERGQLSSLQTALAQLPQQANGFMFVPVDCPAPSSDTVERVAASFRARDPRIQFVVPQYRAKHGHPVCASRAIAQEILALPATAQAREVVHGHVAETLYIDVDDPGILTDVDSPERYRLLVENAASRGGERNGKGSE